MAGLLYLSRLFVYHASAAPGSEASETFKIMQRRLLRGIMHPALVMTYTFATLESLTLLKLVAILRYLGDHSARFCALARR